MTQQQTTPVKQQTTNKQTTPSKVPTAYLLKKIGKISHGRHL